MKVQRKGDNFIAYADGSSIAKTGRGGWAVVVYVAGKPVEFAGAAAGTTNNTMELTAATKALEALPVDAIGVVRTDSNYVVKGVTEWRAGWEKNGWRNAHKKPVANKELWIALFALHDARPKVRIEWVKGHANDPGNIRVDEMALAEARGATI